MEWISLHAGHNMQDIKKKLGAGAKLKDLRDHLDKEGWMDLRGVM